MRAFILTLIFAVSLCSISCSKEDIAEQEELTTVATGTGSTSSPKSGRE